MLAPRHIPLIYILHQPVPDRLITDKVDDGRGDGHHQGGRQTAPQVVCALSCYDVAQSIKCASDGAGAFGEGEVAGSAGLQVVREVAVKDKGRPGTRFARRHLALHPHLHHIKRCHYQLSKKYNRVLFTENGGEKGAGASRDNFFRQVKLDHRLGPAVAPWLFRLPPK